MFRLCRSKNNFFPTKVHNFLTTVNGHDSHSKINGNVMSQIEVVNLNKTAHEYETAIKFKISKSCDRQRSDSYIKNTTEHVCVKNNEKTSNSQDGLNFTNCATSLSLPTITKKVLTNSKQIDQPHLANNWSVMRTLLQIRKSFSDSCLYNNISTTSTMTYSNKRSSRGNLTRGTVEDFLNEVRREEERLSNFRKWEYTDYGHSLSTRNRTSSFIFTVMSYNVLAQCLLVDHSYLYRAHDPRALAWTHRSWALMKEFKYHNPDILCLQEVQESHLSYYKEELKKLGYEGIYKQRTGGKKDGCAVFYKSDKFSVVEAITVEYYQPNTKLLDRDNVAIVVRFCIKNRPNQEFVVATTHLLYNPRRQDVRLAQTQVLLAEIDRISFKNKIADNSYTYVPIIITGDFNLTPGSPAYRLIVDGELRYEGLIKKTLEEPQNVSTNVIGNKFLPRYLRIVNNCQHAELLVQRLRYGQHKLFNDSERKFTKLYHSEFVNNSANECVSLINDEMFTSGVLTHGLDLHSVFDSNVQNKATTFQNKWINVDYIFYSQKFSRDEAKDIEHKLKLVARYSLPTNEQCKQLPTIPNLVFGSDHLPLLATFALEP